MDGSPPATDSKTHCVTPLPPRSFPSIPRSFLTNSLPRLIFSGTPSSLLPPNYVNHQRHNLARRSLLADFFFHLTFLCASCQAPQGGCSRAPHRVHCHRQLHRQLHHPIRACSSLGFIAHRLYGPQRQLNRHCPSRLPLSRAGSPSGSFSGPILVNQPLSMLRRE